MRAALLLVAALAVAAPVPAAVPGPPDAAVRAPFTDPHDREFDFWLGEWEVLLRIRQEDGRWLDATHAVAKIYRVLGGKAVLELWDEQAEGDDAIRGFSLRYFDHPRGEWVIHLDWPRGGRSGLSSLTGSFRHGRVELFSERATPDGGQLISRYTFSDIARDRLRWDDAYSTDGGTSWRHRWIMEFARTGDVATSPLSGVSAHTYHAEGRCPLPELRAFDPLPGRWRGTVEIAGEGAHDASLVAYRVLDGCAVISFLTYEAEGGRMEEMGFHTYSTYAGRLEDARLDSRPGSALRELFGSREGDALVFAASDSTGRGERYRWRFEGTDRLALDVDALDGTAARRVLAASFGRVE